MQRRVEKRKDRLKAKEAARVLAKSLQKRRGRRVKGGTKSGVNG